MTETPSPLTMGFSRHARGLGLSGTIARRIMLRAQQTRNKGSGGYSAKAFRGQGGSTPFPQAEIEAADFESFFRFFPDYLVRDALRGKEVLDFGSGYSASTDGAAWD